MRDQAAAKQQKTKRQKADKSQKVGSFAYIWARISKNPGAVAGMIMIALLLILSFVYPLFSKYDIYTISMTDAYSKPSMEHWMGCDELGRDVMVRLFYGCRYTLSIGVLSVAISAAGGVFLGAIAGYFGGAADNLIMRFLDIFQAFPGMLLAITLAAVLGTGLDKCIIALGVAAIPPVARMMRAQILSVRSLEYVEAAKSINCSQFRIIFHHVIPNSISPLIIQFAMAIASAGLSASSLSFIGLGIKPPSPEWGAMLANARNYIRDYPHMVMFPGIAIMITVLSFNLIGDALRDALDPKLKR